MKEVVVVNMLEAGHDLEQYALDAAGIQLLVVTSLQQLIEIDIHVLHSNVQLSTMWVKEDVISRDQVGMDGKCVEEYYFAELQALRKIIECFLHCFDGDLSAVSVVTAVAERTTYQRASSDNRSASAPRLAQCNTSEAAITDVLEYLELVL